ncbi:hypothetical protein T492DRAFT_883378 [Pavlovales sp. CCMP2436]|nr:hypothetical protein T492DRAFT_883378 [Pavlovales sp. CCMP2436]
MLALRDLATRVSTLEAAAAHEALGVRAAPQPARFHTVTAGPNAAGVSDLVFGQDGTAGRTAFEHDAAGFQLVRNTSAILEAEASCDAHVGSPAQTLVHGESLSFESRVAVRIIELDGATPKPATMTVYVGGTVTWAWSSLQNVAQANSAFVAINTIPGTFYSGAPTLGGAYSLRFDTPGTYYYKSQVIPAARC